jgi:competence CoiA-like predicted nuclease
MQFALVEGQRARADKNLVGTCLLCREPVIAKCGTMRVWHWAHRGKRTCDAWWEPKTEWHQRWQD